MQLDASAIHCQRADSSAVFSSISSKHTSKAAFCGKQANNYKLLQFQAVADSCSVKQKSALLDSCSLWKVRWNLAT